jgi:uroporphyrinogen decarboxylase
MAANRLEREEASLRNRRRDMQFRQDRLTSEERLERLFSKQPIDRVPFTSIATGFNAINAGCTIADYYSEPAKGVQAAISVIEQYNWEKIPHLFLGPLGAVSLGGTISWPVGEFNQAPQIEQHPVTSEEDVLYLTIPDVRTAGLIPRLYDFAKYSKEAGTPYCFIALDELFLCATNLCGIDLLFRWIVKKPDLVHHVMEFVTEFKITIAEYWTETLGSDFIIPWLGEPTTENRLITPKTFEEFVLPYTTEFHEKLIGMGFRIVATHLCGEQNANYPLWSKVHMGEPGIISVSQEVDLEDAMSYFPNDIIMGNIPPALIQSGSPQEVYEATRVCIEKGKKAPGGFILAPGCELPPKSPPYNVWIIMKAIDDFGWYE